jgi:hypothetical protein
MQEGSSIELNAHQSTVHKKVYICCCARMKCLAARAIKPIPLAYSHEHIDQTASATPAVKCVGIFGIMESFCLPLRIFALH